MFNILTSFYRFIVKAYTKKLNLHVQQVSSQHPQNQKRIHKSKIFQLFVNEERLIHKFVEADFLNLIQKHDLNQGRL